MKRYNIAVQIILTEMKRNVIFALENQKLAAGWKIVEEANDQLGARQSGTESHSYVYVDINLTTN